jgi:hypothetical protein
MPEKLADYILHPASGSFSSSANTARCYRLTRHRAQIIDVIGTQLAIGIGNPRHLAFARTHIRRRDIFAGADVTFVDKLTGETTRNPFQLINTIITRVNL